MNKDIYDTNDDVDQGLTAFEAEVIRRHEESCHDRTEFLRELEKVYPSGLTWGEIKQRNRDDEAQQRADDTKFASLWPTADDDWATEPPTWIIEDLIPDNANVALYAPTQFLKSFVAIDLLFAIVTGELALGTQQVINPGPGFYFCGEGYYGARSKRRAAWECHHGIEPVRDVWFADGAPLSNSALLANYITGMKGRLAGRTSRLFVVDTLNRALDGQDEDKAGVAAHYLNIANSIRKEIGGSSLTIGHTGKDLSKGFRGSSGWPAGFDTILMITAHHKNEETGIHTICLTVEKQKDGEDGKKFWLQSQLVETPKGKSLVLLPINEEIALEVLCNKKDTGSSYLTPVVLDQAIEKILPEGGTVGTTKLAEALAELTGRTTAAVSKELRRCKDTLTRYIFDSSNRDIQWFKPMDRQDRETREMIQRIMKNGHDEHPFH